MGRSMVWLQVTAAPCPPVPHCVTAAWSGVTGQGLLGGHELGFRGETRWGHPHSSYAGFLVQCPVPPRATVTFGIEWRHKLSDLPGAHVSPVRAGGFPAEGCPFAGAACPRRWPWGAPPASRAAGEDGESFGLRHRRTRWEQSKGAARPPAAFGVLDHGVSPPRQPQEQPEGPVPARTENKSASCSRPVFKARKVGAVRAVPDWAALPASTCGDRRVPRLPATGAGLGRAGDLPERPCLENLAPTFILSLLFPALCWREGRRDNAASGGAIQCSPRAQHGPGGPKALLQNPISS